MIEVINVKVFGWDGVNYVGRKNDGSSLLGNRFIIGKDGNRKVCNC